MAEKLNIQQFESRPVAAEAILWDGTRKSAKKIIKWLAADNVEGIYKDSTRVVHGEVKETISIEISATFQSLTPNSWLVKTSETYQDESRTLYKTYSSELFAELYRIKA